MFCAVLLLFALVMRYVFSTVFFERAYQEDLQDTTAAVVERVEECFASDEFAAAFAEKDIEKCAKPLSFLRDYATVRYAEIWIVADETVMISYNAQKDTMEFDEIPYRYHPMVERIFAGADVENREYEDIWNRGMFGVGAPVPDKAGGVAAAVITQVSNAHVAATTRSADTAVFLSSAVAIAIALVLAALLSGYFTRPLDKMKAAAETWVTEDYSARTGVKGRNGRDRGDEIGALASSMDVLALRLSKLKAEREESEAARYRFFADVSHELKTPIAVLRGQLEMLKDGMVKDEEEVRAYLCDSLSETKQLERLVEDLLTLAKLQSPEFTLVEEPVCLCDVLTDVRRSNRSRAEETGVTLTFDNPCEDEAACTVMGDYTRIRQLVSILVDNAFKATQRGGEITIEMRCDIAPSIVISDTGKGMSKEEQKRVFERFYSHYNTDKSAGLGLPIANEIAKRHGATLTMESEQGAGTSITISFPTAPK